MKFTSQALVICLAASVLAVCPLTGAAASKQEARVTQIVRDVKLLPSETEARPAAVNDQVREGIAVRTGDKSRSELTFVDLTISRLGANTIYSFNRAGRSVDLESGSILMRVPKNSGGGNVKTDVVSVAITGTTLILETTRAGRSKLIVLEGSSRMSLVKVRGQSRDVAAGQMLDVPAGATTLPMPVNIDLNQVMKTHPLITGFPPLPSRDLIAAAARNQGPPGADDEPVYQGQPVAGQPGGFSPGLPGFGLPPLFPGGRNPGNRDPGSRDPGTRNPGGSSATGKGDQTDRRSARGVKKPASPNDPGGR